jgi:hypothetical protein
MLEQKLEKNMEKHAFAEFLMIIHLKITKNPLKKWESPANSGFWSPLRPQFHLCQGTFCLFQWTKTATDWEFSLKMLGKTQSPMISHGCSSCLQSIGKKYAQIHWLANEHRDVTNQCED